MSYSLHAHGEMMRDRVRMEAYATALRRTIAPGAIVVDIGTGTGVLALLACRYGAKRVYAIEPSPVIETAREIARANGVEDRIEFIPARSTRVALPEAADVIVSDLRGVLPLFERHLPSIIDARRRFLRPGGTLIPRRDVVWMAVATAPDLYEPYRTPWAGNDDDLDLRPARSLVTSTWHKCRARPSHLCLPPQRWVALDFAMVDDANVTGEVVWTVHDRGAAHGLVLWFDAHLGEDVGFTSAPGAPETVYGQAFFPWPEPVRLAVGDTVSVELTATLATDDYVWSWNTRIRAGGEAGPITTDFRQSTLFGAPLSPAALARRSADHIPTLGEEGRLDLFVLESLSARVPLGRIADDVLVRFPACCSDWHDALARVADLSVKYGG